MPFSGAVAGRNAWYLFPFKTHLCGYPNSAVLPLLGTMARQSQPATKADPSSVGLSVDFRLLQPDAFPPKSFPRLLGPNLDQFFDTERRIAHVKHAVTVCTYRSQVGDRIDDSHT